MAVVAQVRDVANGSLVGRSFFWGFVFSFACYQKKIYANAVGVVIKYAKTEVSELTKR